jgi:GNAT superfamily N-acetyltransferase
VISLSTSIDFAEYHQGGFVVSTDPSRLDLAVIHDFLARASYWARHVPLSVVQKSLDNSLCFGVYDGDRQIGFARVVTDRAVIAYLADVFILEEYRDRGLGKWLIRCIVEHPELQGLRRWMLATHNAHGLYAQVGFSPLSHPEWFMEIFRPNPYEET